MTQSVNPEDGATDQGRPETGYSGGSMVFKLSTMDANRNGGPSIGWLISVLCDAIRGAGVGVDGLRTLDRSPSFRYVKISVDPGTVDAETVYNDLRQKIDDGRL